MTPTLERVARPVSRVRPAADDEARPARRRYPPEVRQRAVEMFFETIERRDGVRYGVVPRVARHLDVHPQSVRYWVRQAENDGHWRSSPIAPATRPQAPTRRSSLRAPLAVYAASRVVVLATLAVAACQPHQGLARLPRLHIWPALPSSGRLLAPFATWDAAWYVRLAGHGYNAAHPPFTAFNKDLAFFPLWPMIVRASMALTGTGAIVAGALAALVAGALATIAVWVAAKTMLGTEAATRAVAVWCFFPGAYVLSLVYSEGVTIACAAACLTLLLRRRWLLAGVAAAAGAATQPIGLVLVLCCAWQAAVAVRDRREWPALVAPVIAPAGAVGYFAYLWAHGGSPLAWFMVERRFWAHRRLGPAWTVARPLVHFLQHPASVDDGIRALGFLMAVAGIILVWRWRPPTVFTIWAVGLVAMTLMSAPVGVRPRFVLAAFPLLFALVRRLPKPAAYTLVALEAPLLALLTFVTVTTLRTVP